MGRPSILNQKQEKYIIEQYKNGFGSTTIAQNLGLKSTTVAGFIRRTIGLRSSSDAARKYYCNENFFEKIDTEEKAYWLGFLYADGYLCTNKTQLMIGISLSIKDINHLNKFNKSIESTYPIHIYHSYGGYSNNTEYCRILITSRKMFTDLKKHGVVEHKTLILKPPNLLNELHRHFIRGYLDGDGCITSRLQKHKISPQYSIKIVGTDKILQFIKDFIEKNNCATINKFYKRHNTDIISSIDFGGNKQVKKFLDLLYKDASIYLDRKYDRYMELYNLMHGRPTSKEIG